MLQNCNSCLLRSVGQISLRVTRVHHEQTRMLVNGVISK